MGRTIVQEQVFYGWVTERFPAEPSALVRPAGAPL